MQKIPIATYHKSFRSQHAIAQHLGVKARAYVCTLVQLIATRSDFSSSGEFKLPAKIIRQLTPTAETGLRYATLILDSTCLFLFTDSPFVNTKELRSQLVIIIVMADDKVRCKIVHYGSSPSRLVACRVIDTGVHDLIIRLDDAFPNRKTFCPTSSEGEFPLRNSFLQDRFQPDRSGREHVPW